MNKICLIHKQDHTSKYLMLPPFFHLSIKCTLNQKEWDKRGFKLRMNVKIGHSRENVSGKNFNVLMIKRQWMFMPHDLMCFLSLYTLIT